MSTLSLADLGPKMRRELGLETLCNCACSNTGMVASIPVIEASRSQVSEPAGDDPRGTAWLKTGLHRLRIPALQSPATAVANRQGDYC
jgi:hypothetical protein